MGGIRGDGADMPQEGYEDAPIVFVQASELPKGALVEFQVNFHTGRPCFREVTERASDPQSADVNVDVDGDEDDDDDDDEEDLDVICSSSGSKQHAGMSWEMSTAERPGHGARAMVFISGQSSLPLDPQTSEACRLTRSRLGV